MQHTVRSEPRLHGRWGSFPLFCFFFFLLAQSQKGKYVSGLQPNAHTDFLHPNTQNASNGSINKENHIRNRTIRYSRGIDSNCPPAEEEQRIEMTRVSRTRQNVKRTRNSIRKRLVSITRSREPCEASPGDMS